MGSLICWHQCTILQEIVNSAVNVIQFCCRRFRCSKGTCLALGDCAAPLQLFQNCRMRRLLSQVSKPGEGSGQRSKVIDFLEREQRPGLPGLDRDAFRAVVQRFCELTALPISDVRYSPLTLIAPC